MTKTPHQTSEKKLSFFSWPWPPKYCNSINFKHQLLMTSISILMSNVHETYLHHVRWKRRNPVDLLLQCLSLICTVSMVLLQDLRVSLAVHSLSSVKSLHGCRKCSSDRKRGVTCHIWPFLVSFLFRRSPCQPMRHPWIRDITFWEGGLFGVARVRVWS